MRLIDKFIKWGTASGEVNSRSMPANFTPSNYTPTQVGSEGNDKVSSHLKGIDAALAGSSGSAGDLSEASFSLANNQSVASNVTGFAFANATVRGFDALVTVEINATANLYEEFQIKGIQKGSEWDYSIISDGDNSQVNFSVTTSGQVQYTSGNITGFVDGAIKFRAITTTV